MPPRISSRCRRLIELGDAYTKFAELELAAAKRFRTLALRAESIVEERGACAAWLSALLRATLAHAQAELWKLPACLAGLRLRRAIALYGSELPKDQIQRLGL
jgi:hypothetical protein